MQAAGAISDVLVALPFTTVYRSPESKNLYSYPSDTMPFLSGSAPRSFPFCIPKLIRGFDKFRAKGLTVRVGESAGHNLEPIAPLHLESPVGQLLERVLQTHPHILPATIDQQLKNLWKIRDAEEDGSPSSSQYLLLYKDEEEGKTNGSRGDKQRFVEKGILMIPKILPTSDPTGRVDFWPNQEQELESVHSSEAFEMIQSHLAIILGDRNVGSLQNMVEISKIKLGKLYVVSIVYGYFIRRVD